MPQSHLLYGGRTVVVELQNRVIPAVAVEILRWPQGHRTANSYVLQAAGVAVELLRGVITFFISTFTVEICHTVAVP